MLLALLITIWIGLTAWHLKKEHFLFAFFLLLSGLYECTGVFFNSGFLDEETVQAQGIFSSYVQGWEFATISFTLALIVFCILVHVSDVLVDHAFSLFGILDSQEHLTRRSLQVSRPDVFYYLIFFVFVCGVISVNANAGSVRLLDYEGADLPTTPFFTYGNVLLATVMTVAVAFVAQRNWTGLSLIAVGIAPLVHELVITSKRQYFAPSVLVIILSVLYSRQIKAKFSIILVLMGAAITFFGVQYYLRVAFMEGEDVSTQGLFDGTLVPQLGEFVAIGSTTLYAWGDYVLSGEPVTLGAHWTYHALNAVPYIRLGDILFPDYATDLFASYRAISPWGGLSILADSILGFGVAGLGAAAIVIGALIRYWHGLLHRYLANGIELSVRGVYVISMIATLCLKYRSGVGDIIQNVVQLTILYFFIIGIGSVLSPGAGAPIASRKASGRMTIGTRQRT